MTLSCSPLLGEALLERFDCVERRRLATVMQ
uniref:Uncharacterized protein n=1 Tax=Arundo donax TaxID=35708 RepID=A0A0A9F3Z1_ARUDO